MLLVMIFRWLCCCGRWDGLCIMVVILWLCVSVLFRRFWLMWLVVLNNMSFMGFFWW